MAAHRARFVPLILTATLAGVGVAGCSSEPPAEPRSAGTVPAGTAMTSIDGRDAKTDTKVLCETYGTLTTVTVGNDDSGFTAVVSSDEELALKSITIRNLDGFTGSYFDGLGDPADVTMTGRTYDISGVADGFETDSPSYRTSGEFAIKASC